MKNNIAEKFLVLIQHPNKSRFIVSNRIRNVGLIGSILLDLENTNNLEILNGKLMVKSKGSDLPKSHKMILDTIEQSSKNLSIKRWIGILSRQSKKIQKEVLLGLESKGIIKINRKSFLGIKYYKTQLANLTIRDNIIFNIRDEIFTGSQIKDEIFSIIGIIEACKMYRVITNNVNEITICKKKLAKMIKSDYVAQGVEKVNKEWQSAIAGAMVVTTIALTLSSK